MVCNMPNSLFAIWHPVPLEEESTSVCPGDRFDHGESVLEVEFINGMQQVKVKILVHHLFWIYME